MRIKISDALFAEELEGNYAESLFDVEWDSVLTIIAEEKLELFDIVNFISDKIYILEDILIVDSTFLDYYVLLVPEVFFEGESVDFDRIFGLTFATNDHLLNSFLAKLLFLFIFSFRFLGVFCAIGFFCYFDIVFVDFFVNFGRCT